MPVSVEIEHFKLDRLRAACVAGRLDFVDILQQCHDGRAQFWDHPEACAVTSLGVSGDYRTCYITVAGGTLQGLWELNEQIEQFARANDCQAIHTTGRVGFEKFEAQRPQGYKRIAIMYEKVL